MIETVDDGHAVLRWTRYNSLTDEDETVMSDIRSWTERGDVCLFGRVQRNSGRRGVVVPTREDLRSVVTRRGRHGCRARGLPGW